MKVIKQMTIVLAVLLFCGLGSAHAYTNVAFSIGFHDTLSPYGSWVNVGTYGEVWRPHVAASWRPFTYGHWVYTSAGTPYWDGYEPYAWCVYHYGHWQFVPGYGWCWVPGYEYSAAPVSWAYGDGYIGWSPIYGYNGYDANFWIFVDRARFGYRNYAGIYLGGDRVRPLFARRAIRVVSRPFGIREVERITGRRVQVVSTRERIVELNGHRTRLVVPRDREQTVIKHIARASKAHPKTIVEKSNRHETVKTKVANAKSSGYKTVEKSKAYAHKSVAKTKEFAHKTVSHGKSVEHKSIAKVKEKAHATKQAAVHEKARVGGSGGSGTSHRVYSNAKTTIHAKSTHVSKEKAPVKANVKQKSKTSHGTGKTKHPRH